MALLLVIGLAVMSLAVIEQKGNKGSVGGGLSEEMQAAQTNARMALLLAIGELQKAAGHDQRVTATASILGHSNNDYASATKAVDGRKHWVGVWDTSNYSPETPDNKSFVRWLVSSGNQSALDQLADVSSAPASDDVVIFEGMNAAATVKVPKVAVGSGTGNTSYYAYWVEDEGVKADLEWNESNLTDAEREQATRLAGVPGPDYGVFGGPFENGLSYPLEEGGDNVWLDAMKKAFSPADMSLVMNYDADLTNWLKEMRENVTLGTRGVLADVKKGGLRRDLSLAFEMDEDADVSAKDQPALFNKQEGEFVGGDDHLQALYPYSGMAFPEKYAINNTDANDGAKDDIAGLAPGMPVKERFLYRVTHNDGSPFSGDIKRVNYRSPRTDAQALPPLYGYLPNSVVRGPNWWALRDYYNLYKRLVKSGSGYALGARSYYPNHSADPDNRFDGLDINPPRPGGLDNMHKTYRHFSQPTLPYSSYYYDMEVSAFGDYVFHPARANYTPVIMGMAALYSMKVSDYDTAAKEGNLTLAIDPIIYLWNPFNVRLKADRFAISLQRGHGGKMSFVVEKPDGTREKYGPAKTDMYIQKKANGQGNLTYLVRNLDMDPGEVMIVSPGAGSDNTELHDEATPGTNLTDKSGIEVEYMPKTLWNQYPVPPSDRYQPDGRWELVGWEPNVKVGPGDKVYCLYDICLWHGSTRDADGENTRLTNSAEHYWIASYLPNEGAILPKDLFTADQNYTWNHSSVPERVQIVGGNFAARINAGFKEYFVPDMQSRLDSVTGEIKDYPYTSWPQLTLSDPPAEGKFFFGINSLLMKPTRYSKVDGSAMPNQHPVEVFSQFNPFRTGTFISGHRTNVLNETYSSLSVPGSINSYIQKIGIQFPTAVADQDRGFWGETMHANGGSTAVPFIEIPSAPLISLVDFTNANLSLRAQAPYKDLGNSHASIYIPGNSIYANTGESPGPVTVSDASWLINDALFDRYYLSGITPDFIINHSGYTPHPEKNIEKALADFFIKNEESAHANPFMIPHIPAGKTRDIIIDELTPTETNHDGYKKLAAYAHIRGVFNVNSTSVKAWQALLLANRDLAVTNTGGGVDKEKGTPYPSLKTPVGDSGSDIGWDGFSRLTDDQITDLATEIVNQVKARGPFMSLSDFVNRQVSNNPSLNASGALQAALDNLGATSSIKSAAGGSAPKDPTATGYQSIPFLAGDADLSKRLTTEGIAGDIRQADILRPLAPRLSARTDTFRIRAYGEVRDSSGNIIAQATCEAVVQRVPEYVDPSNNEPWDDDTKEPLLNEVNKAMGRRFEIRSFRWLDSEEV